MRPADAEASGSLFGRLSRPDSGKSLTQNDFCALASRAAPTVLLLVSTIRVPVVSVGMARPEEIHRGLQSLPKMGPRATAG